MCINRVTRLQVKTYFSFLPLSKKSHKAENIVKATIIPSTEGFTTPDPRERIKFKNDADINPRVDQRGASAIPELLFCKLIPERKTKKYVNMVNSTINEGTSATT